MNCPRCGNEVSPEEAFCGQCGAPISPSAQPTEMVNTPPPHNGLPNWYQANRHFAQPGYNYEMQPPSNSQPPQVPPFLSNTNSLLQQQSPARPTGPNQQEGFYQDATEAIPLPPNNAGQSYSSAYPQQAFSNTPPSGAYPPIGQPPSYGFGPQMGPPLQPGNAGQGYAPPFATGGYENGRIGQQKRRSNPAILLVSILLALALISVVGLATLYFLRSSNDTQQLQQAGSATASTISSDATATVDAGSTATVTANATATAGAVPTATPTAAATATTAPTPTPTTVPTATPDTNFLLCGQACVANGFSTEYPSGWKVIPSSDQLTIQFVNPAQADEYAAFKTPAATTGSAGDLVTNDLQVNYASKPDFVVVSSSTVTISGETWVKAVATFQGDTQKERVEVFGTVHQGKAYIIELQAPDAQFEAINSQYFVNMTGRFQFQ